MKFYNREREIVSLENIGGKFRIAVIGRRRIGKTRLVEEFYNKNRLTLFISSEKSEKEIISDWADEYKEIPRVNTFKDLFENLFSQHPDKIIFIDEIQNVLKVNRSFLSDLQRLIDKYKPTLIVSGSLISIMKKIIEEYKSPLFGRIDLILKLDELNFKTIAEICRDLGLNLEQSVKLYSVFGGVPKYYELIEKIKKFNLEKFILDMFVYYPRPLYSEVRTMLKEEFGSEERMFFSILSAISQGNTRLSEIAGFIGKKQTDITKYISMLNKDFEVIIRKRPIVPKKSGVYKIVSNMVSFWFSNIWKHQELIEGREEEKLAGIVKSNLNSWYGKRFEKICREVILDLKLPFKPTKIGRQWGRIQGKPKGENTYEIDIVCLNEPKKIALFIECKWSSLTEKQARKVLVELKEKSKFVEWERKKEYFGLFAKNIKGKDKLRKEGFFVWDLGDLLFD